MLRGIMTNMMILSLTHLMPPECRAAYVLQCLPPPPGPSPRALRPTILQQTVPHPAWIGAAPDPGLRDNLILHCGNYDEDDLCNDLTGGLCDGFDNVEKRGLILWGDPFRVDGWEVSEGFARKWKFLLMGCTKLMDSTNRSRSKRGEDPLVVQI